jgi:pimeloyl-ACP methyl ester carboxylesterase
LPPREGLRLSSDLAGARLLVLPGIGHFPQEEGPEDFSRAVSRFPDEAPGR